MKNQAVAAGTRAEADIDRLVRQYLPLVRQIAKRYSRLNPESYEDLLQVGCVGLLKAARVYDPNHEQKASFKTFSLLYIKGEIRHYLRDHSSLVQIPRRLNEISSRISAAEESLTQELEHAPTVREISSRTGFSEAEVREVLQSWEACTRYESLDGDDSDGREDNRSLSEMVADRRQLDEIRFSEDREVLGQALHHLGERARQVIEFVYFYDFTQKEAAQILGVSEMGVSRTLKSAMKSLKEILFTEIF